MHIAEIDGMINNTTPKKTRKNTKRLIATWDKWTCDIFYLELEFEPDIFYKIGCLKV